MRGSDSRPRSARFSGSHRGKCRRKAWHGGARKIVRPEHWIWARDKSSNGAAGGLRRPPCLPAFETVGTMLRFSAMGSIGRAATILSRAKLDIAGQVAKVDPEGCVACASCVKVCPYGTPMINDLKKAHLPLPSSPAPSSAGMLLEEIANFNLQGLSQFHQRPHSR